MLAIVLARRDFREADQIVAFYTREKGKLELLAKGVKKITSKHSGNLLLGALAEIEIADGKEINYLTKVQPICIFKNFRKDLLKSLAVNYVLNFTDKALSVNESDENVFVLLREWLLFADGAEKIGESMVYGYIIKFLGCLGYLPELDRCYNCGVEKDIERFDLRGGLICRKCAALIKKDSNHSFKETIISEREIDSLKIMSRENWQVINALGSNAALFILIQKYAQFHCEREVIDFVSFARYYTDN